MTLYSGHINDLELGSRFRKDGIDFTVIAVVNDALIVESDKLLQKIVKDKVLDTAKDESYVMIHSDCPAEIPEETIKFIVDGVHGKIHIYKVSADSQRTLCGVRWTNFDSDTPKSVCKRCARIHKQGIDKQLIGV
jgi:hypothetical protein